MHQITAKIKLQYRIRRNALKIMKSDRQANSLKQHTDFG